MMTCGSSGSGSNCSAAVSAEGGVSGVRSTPARLEEATRKKANTNNTNIKKAFIAKLPSSTGERGGEEVGRLSMGIISLMPS
jgi:hypothetical protein